MLIGLLALGSLVATDLTGIWTGQAPGRRDQLEDLAFQFKLEGQTLTGKMFGDEFDLPIEEGALAGDQVKFVVITTNYYSGNKTKTVFTGTIRGNELELTRERMPAPGEDASKRENPKHTFKLKKLT
jgi:hypothetical protein